MLSSSFFSCIGDLDIIDHYNKTSLTNALLFCICQFYTYVWHIGSSSPLLIPLMFSLGADHLVRLNWNLSACMSFPGAGLVQAAIAVACSWLEQPCPIQKTSFLSTPPYRLALGVFLPHCCDVPWDVDEVTQMSHSALRIQQSFILSTWMRHQCPNIIEFLKGTKEEGHWGYQMTDSPCGSQNLDHLRGELHRFWSSGKTHSIKWWHEDPQHPPSGFNN